MPLDVSRLESLLTSRIGAAAIAVAAVSAAHANALEASFQFDDWEVIVRDPRVQSVAAWWAAMPGIRPLLKLSYALGHASGLGVVGFHAVNLAIHASNTLIAQALIRQLALRNGRDAIVAGWISLASALVFALHPLQTEAVTYASGRSSSLSTGLVLASILLWIAAQKGVRRPRWLQAASLLAMGMALAVKETAVIVPAALMLWRTTDPSQPADLRSLLRDSALHWVTLLAALGAALALPAYRSLFATSLATRSPLENLVAQTHGVAYLLGQFVRIDRLNADPALQATTTLGVSGFAFVFGLLALLGLALIQLRRWPTASFAILWTGLWLLPTNSLLARLDLVNDRQAYGALLGPALLLGLAVGGLARRRPLAAGIVLALLALGLGVATHRRNEVYRNEASFWRAVIEDSPHNARAFNNLGVALAADCDAAGAKRAWRRALALDPEYVRAAVNLRLALDAPEQGLDAKSPCEAAARK